MDHISKVELGSGPGCTGLTDLLVSSFLEHVKCQKVPIQDVTDAQCVYICERSRVSRTSGLNTSYGAEALLSSFQTAQEPLLSIPFCRRDSAVLLVWKPLTEGAISVPPTRIVHLNQLFFFIMVILIFVKATPGVVRAPVVPRMEARSFCM